MSQSSYRAVESSIYLNFMRFCLVFAALVVLSSPAARSDIRGCECSLESSLTSNVRGCSLCLEAARQSEAEGFFLLKDANQTKPNRWLALPRKAYDGVNPLSRMSAEDRLALWNLAIRQGEKLWGGNWGVAMNGDISRTQCHMHVHIGKLLENQEPGEFRPSPQAPEDPKRAEGHYADGPADLPALSDGTGLWFHPVGKRLHVHAGEQTTESVLMR